ncbi:MAG: DegV family EDD domain-containing protein [Lachnospiraceae bacterium]|nr:DegV family EDD domain-containing protein [Lachnospiraceae bacterium]
MREIVLSTESGSDLPEKLIRKYHFKVVPMHVIIDGKSYDDGRFPLKKVYEYYERTGQVPATAAVNENEYASFWNGLKRAHTNAVIMHFTYSSKASATHAAAVNAVKGFSDVYVIDTLNVSGGCTAHMVSSYEYIEKKKEEGEITDFAKLAEELQALAAHAVCHFIPGTLEYLRAGGRVSNAQYIGGTLLKVKPLIEMEDGSLIATKRYRGTMDKIVDRFMKEFVEKYKPKRDCLYLMYSMGLADNVLTRMAENATALGFLNYEYVRTGCVISCHGGKGAMGLAAIRE